MHPLVAVSPALLAASETSTLRGAYEYCGNQRRSQQLVLAFMNCIPFDTDRYPRRVNSAQLRNYTDRDSNSNALPNSKDDRAADFGDLIQDVQACPLCLRMDGRRRVLS